MNSAGFDEILRALENARTVGVASHLRPDADALGSTIAFSLWLQSLGKAVTAWNEEGTTSKFRYLPGHEIVSLPPAEPVRFDVFVALDTSVKKRLGTVLPVIAPGTPLVNIDHHISNEAYGDVNYIDPTAPATGQILVELFRHAGAEITPAIAANLFAAISTDTGSFQYAGTDGRTFAAASELVRCGVNVAELSREMYENQPKRRFELLRFALNEAVFTCDDRVASFSLSLDDARRLAVLPEDNEGIIDHLRSIEGVQAAVFFEELEDGKVRVSARSKAPAIDVCQICQVFKGGGHPMAAGARIHGSLAEVREKFLEVVCNEVRQRN
ncbi:MAG: bifunctional oligoribonuclease/PAP phosphatase NrnA [Terrimicrobiaceae bacterium]|nr:bifunctional oligoribonuclease/PAP phosphatase NrnA [Terrimicrobiaceae bacterium]